MLCNIGYDIKQIDKVFVFLENFCAFNGINNESLCQLKMIADEIVSNIINYVDVDYGQKISIFATVKNSTIRLRMVDFNGEFNPLSMPEPDVSLSLGERRVGGLGIYLVRKSALRVCYKRQNWKNVLTIICRYGE